MDATHRGQALRVCPSCEGTMAALRCGACDTPTVSQASLARGAGAELIGEVIKGQYRLDSLLGRGGMGTVYRGVQLSVDRPVAVKVLSPELAGDLRAMKRFQREARLTSRLSHNNVVRLFDFGLTAEGTLFLVMELLEGRELSELLAAGGAVAPARALDIAIQIVAGLQHAHAANVLHRDLKPPNIFLAAKPGEPEVVKLMDFGIARSIEDAALSRLTVTGSVIGTPAYMSPEQIMGGELTGATDLYAVGILLFEMLAGEPPFRGATLVEVLMHHLHDPPPPLRARAPDLPCVDALQALIERLLAKAPQDRPASALHAQAMLREVRDQLLALQTRGTSAQRAPEAATVVMPAPPPVAPSGAGPGGPPAAAAGPSAAETATVVVTAPAPAAARTASETSGPPASAAAGRDRRVMAPVLALAALGVALGWAVLGAGGARRPGPEPGAERAASSAASRQGAPEAQPLPASPARPDPAPSQAPSPAPQPAPVGARVHLTSTPTGADVSLRDQPIGQTPLDVQLPVGGAAVTLVASLAGHVPTEVTLRASDAPTVHIALEREPDRPAPPPESRRRRREAGPSAEAPAVARPAPEPQPDDDKLTVD